MSQSLSQKLCIKVWTVGLCLQNKTENMGGLVLNFNDQKKNTFLII